MSDELLWGVSSRLRRKQFREEMAKQSELKKRHKDGCKMVSITTTKGLQLCHDVRLLENSLQHPTGVLEFNYCPVCGNKLT